MADPGVWNLSAGASQTVYVNIGPAQGPLVVYRIHNDGPDTVFAGSALNAGVESGAAIPAGSDCDISGSPITIRIEGFLHTLRASGAYELICCQPVT
jgi:hypothetical protein